MRIRKYEPADAAHLNEVFCAAVRQTGRLAYSEQQVAVWAANAPDAAEYEERATDGRVLLVAVDDRDRPLAYADLEMDGHIDHLFCHPDAGRRGLASALYDELEKTALRLKIARLHVEASGLARPLFLRKGFTEIARRDFEMDGVPVYNYAMEKPLCANAAGSRDPALR
jgi:putative acetyltransferase